MKDRIIVLIALAFCFYILFSTEPNEIRTKVYDCSLSEISPDFPIDVKEECRRLRKEHFDRANKYTT